MIKTYIKKLSVFSVLLVAFTSCDIEQLESAQSVAEGGSMGELYSGKRI